MKRILLTFCMAFAFLAGATADGLIAFPAPKVMAVLLRVREPEVIRRCIT